MLYRHKPDSIDRTLMLTLAALILFVVANSFPFLTFKLEGRSTTMNLMTGVIQLYEDGMWPLALLVFGATILVPLVKLLATTYVLLPLRLGRRLWGLARVFRATETMHPWAMMEVFLLGVIVAYVKLSDLATLELGVALFAFIALILVMIAADVALDPREVWDRLGRQAATRRLTGAGLRLAGRLPRLRPGLPRPAGRACALPALRCCPAPAQAAQPGAHLGAA